MLLESRPMVYTTFRILRIIDLHPTWPKWWDSSNWVIVEVADVVRALAFVVWVVPAWVRTL